ncbi:MAG: MmgE/PrpD family protein [Hyphomicrobiaceae bacterium]
MARKPQTALKKVPEAEAKARPDAEEIAVRLAAFACRTRHDAIPEPVRRRALHHMLDAAGIAVASTRYDFAHRMLTAVRGLGGAGSVPVLGMPAALSMRDAAMVNGFLCHGLDFDDTHMGGVVHPTASILPTVLSAAAHVGASGKAMVTAYVIGVEVASRLGEVAQGGFHLVGFHPTGMIGVFGCTLAAGRLMGLNEKEMRNAQGIALSLASGSLQFLENGAWNKRLHPGWAAQAGLTAAAMAREGFVGASEPYEGRFGVFNAYLGKEAGRADYSFATADLGKVWELKQVAIKPYPACHMTHGCIDAALALAKQGVDWRRITQIEATVPEGVFKVICEPEAPKLAPATAYDAQFSLQYLTAAAFVRNRFTLAELEPETLTDPDVLALTRKVRYGAYVDSPYPKAYSGEVTVTLDDGRKLSHREHINRGAADRPLSNDEIVEKFRGNVAMACDEELADRMAGAMLGLEGAPRGADALKVFSPACA